MKNEEEKPNLRSHNSEFALAAQLDQDPDLPSFQAGCSVHLHYTTPHHTIHTSSRNKRRRQHSRTALGLQREDLASANGQGHPTHQPAPLPEYAVS